MELLQCYPTSSSSDDGDEGEGEVDTVPSSGAKIPRAREVFSSSAGAKAESTETRVEERPEKRQRIRNFPHVDGNYATHVYVDLGATGGHGDLRESLSHVAGRVAARIKAETNLAVYPILEAAGEEEVHISLSRTVPIRAGQIDTFKSLLRKQLRKFKPFQCRFGDLVVLRNDERTTCFVAIAIEGGRENLDVLVDWVDTVFKRHGLREYYKCGDRLHHLSLLWAPGAVYDDLKAGIQGSASLKALLAGDWVGRGAEVASVVTKIGNQVHVVI